MAYKLYHGDCLEILPTLDAGSVDAVITDPPYGIASIWKGGFSKNHGWGAAGLQQQSRNEWDEKAPKKETFDLMLSMCKTAIIWGGNYFPLPVSRGWLVWVKPERGFSLSEAELAWTNIEMPMRVYECRRSDPDRKHPTQKPLSLMRWCVENYTRPGDTVLDPFMGSGTTGVAAIQTGRNFIGIEQDAGYFAIAEKRIHEATLQPQLFSHAMIEQAKQVSLI